MSVYNRLVPLIVERFGTLEEDITMDSKFKEELGADSLDVVEFIMEIEDNFEIEVSDEEAEKMETVSDVVKYIENLL